IDPDCPMHGKFMSTERAGQPKRRDTMRESLTDRGINCDKVVHSDQPNEPPTNPAQPQEWVVRTTEGIRRGKALFVGGERAPLLKSGQVVGDSHLERIKERHNATLKP